MENDKCETCGKRFPTNAFGSVFGLSRCAVCGQDECGDCRDYCRLLRETETEEEVER